MLTKTHWKIISLTAIASIGLASFNAAQAEKSACDQLVKQEVNYYDTLQQTNVTRDYFIYLPADYCKEKHHKTRPTIFGLHGYYGTASGFALSTSEGALNKLADEKNLIMVYPQGMSMQSNPSSNSGYDSFYSSWNFLIPAYYNPSYQDDQVLFNNKEENICNIKKMGDVNPIPKQPGCYRWDGVCAWTSCFDDASYLLAIQQKVIATLNSNPQKQYLIGISNGAMMVYRMACQYPEKFQAAVAIAGTTMRHMNCYRAESPKTINPNLEKGETSLLIFINNSDIVIFSK